MTKVNGDNFIELYCSRNFWLKEQSAVQTLVDFADNIFNAAMSLAKNEHPEKRESTQKKDHQFLWKRNADFKRNFGNLKQYDILKTMIKRNFDDVLVDKRAFKNALDGQEMTTIVLQVIDFLKELTSDK